MGLYGRRATEVRSQTDDLEVVAAGVFDRTHVIGCASEGTGAGRVKHKERIRNSRYGGRLLVDAAQSVGLEQDEEIRCGSIRKAANINGADSEISAQKERRII